MFLLLKFSTFHRVGSFFPVGPSLPLLKMVQPAPPEVYDLGVPILGICYGLHTMAAQLGGSVFHRMKKNCYAQVSVTNPSRLLKGISDHKSDGDAPLLDVLDESWRQGSRITSWVQFGGGKRHQRRLRRLLMMSVASTGIQFHP